MENSEPQILDISKVVIVPSDTEIPVHNNPIQTKRALCSNFPENSVILDNLEKIVQVVTDIQDDIEEGKECVNNVPQHINELQAVFDPLNVEECTQDLFIDGNYQVIDNIEDLRKYLSEILIRFDTNPHNYTKQDYQYLLYMLSGVLLYLYNEIRVLNPKITINDTIEIPKVENTINVNVTSGNEHITVSPAESGIQISANVGQMEVPSTKLATVNDIRNYIEQRLEWQIQ